MDNFESDSYWGANAIMDWVAEALFDETLVLLGEDGAPFFDKTKPVAFRSDGPVWPNNHIHVLRPKGVDPNYLTLILNITDYAGFIDGSTRDKLTQSKMNDIPVLLPSMVEQNEISDQVGQRLYSFDVLAKEAQSAITLLQERRAALISAAVTGKIDVRGLVEPSSEMEAA